MSANAETLMRSLVLSHGPEPGEATRAAKPSVERVGGGPPGLLRDPPDQVVVEVGPTAPEEIEGRAHQAPVLEAEGRVVPQRLDGLREAAPGEAVNAAEDERRLGEDDGADEDGLAGSDRAGDDTARRPRLSRIVSLVEMADEDVGVEGDHRRRPRRTARANLRATESSTARSVAVLGSASRNSHSRGTWNFASRSAAKARSSSSASGSLATTNALISCPSTGSATPITAASTTRGCSRSVFSISTEETFSPPRRITSRLRSTK